MAMLSFSPVMLSAHSRSEQKTAMTRFNSLQLPFPICSDSLNMLTNNVDIKYSCIFGMLHVLSNQWFFFSVTEGIVKAYVISFFLLLSWFLILTFQCNLYKMYLVGKMDTETNYNLFWNVLWACVNCTFCKIQDDVLYIFCLAFGL